MSDDQDDLFGASKGGRARDKALTPERKTEIAKAAAEARWHGPPKEEKAKLLSQIEYAEPGSAAVKLGFDSAAQRIWATQADMGAMFGVDVSVISRHLRNIFNEGELAEELHLQKMQISGVHPRAVSFYSLDVIISVGYRVNSKRATAFRQWATRTLRTYLEHGYVINEKLLRDSPEKLNQLAASVRALRSSEKQIYSKVRECFKISASDYDPQAQEVKTFYALLQDKFHHAVTGVTSSKLIMDRADYKRENMGLQSMKGEKPTAEEAQTGKNYLKEEELYRLHLLSEQFLLYAESTALSGKKMTMQSLHAQLDRLLELNDYPLFDGYKDFIKDEAIRHAKRELALYRKRCALEARGIKYNEELLEEGEYDDLLIGT